MKTVGELKSYITHAVKGTQAGVEAFADLRIGEAEKRPNTTNLYERIRLTLRFYQETTLPRTQFNDPNIDIVKHRMAQAVHDKFYGELRRDLIELRYAMERSGLGFMAPQLLEQIEEIITKTEVGNVDEFITTS